jgi:response regulator RpfG family c-di-GMP phosphodiesterase
MQAGGGEILGRAARARVIRGNGASVGLTNAINGQRVAGMAAATEQNFSDYKRAETKALEILREMKATSPRKVDIELALLVALFELHKGTTAPGTIGKIVQSHMETLVPYYTQVATEKN